MRQLPSVRLALGAVVAVSVVALAGCGVPADPTPSPTATPTTSPSATAPVAEPTTPATAVSALPSTAYLRVTATAEVGDEEVRLELTFARAQVAAAAPDAFDAVQAECPNAITSQLELAPGYEPTGVITSELTMSGRWPDGMTVGVGAGGTTASFGEGTNVAPTEDGVGKFGCTFPSVTGPGTTRFVSLLLGDPSVSDRTDLDQQLARGYFGLMTGQDSTEQIRWRDCVIQLSPGAQRMATISGWTQQTQGAFGCLIGDPGSV